MLIWLNCVLPNRLLGVRMNSCDPPWLLTQSHPQDSVSILPAAPSTSFSSSSRAWITAMATSQASRAVAPIRGIHCDLDTLLQLHLHRTGFFERKINSLSQRQQHSKILAKYCPWWVTLAELIWHLPENCPWIVIKILKCAHYLEDYSSCAVSS